MCRELSRVDGSPHSQNLPTAFIPDITTLRFRTPEVRGASVDAIPAPSRMAQPCPDPGDPDPHPDASMRFVPTTPAVAGSGAHDDWGKFFPDEPHTDASTFVPTTPAVAVDWRNFFPDNQQGAVELIRTSKAARDAAMVSTCDERLNATDSFGDGDQKPILDGRKSLPLRALWMSSGDLFEKLEEVDPNPILCACFAGNAALMSSVIHAAQRPGGHPLTPMLEFRY